MLNLHYLDTVIPVAARASCLCGRLGVYTARECIGVPVATIVGLVIGAVGVDTAVHPRRHISPWLRTGGACEPHESGTRVAGLGIAAVSALILFRLWQSMLARYLDHLAR
jgi:hypothetical protein